MHDSNQQDSDATSISSNKLRTLGEFVLLVTLFFVYAGDMPPMVNEAHYLVKAKNFWQPEWCQNDLFAASGKAHTTYYVLLGWPTCFVSLAATAWIGRLVCWILLAIGLQRLCWRLLRTPFASVAVATVWISGIEYGNLAGEWVVGGGEAKVVAYGFVLLALADMVDRKWKRVWPLLGIASAFHVLSGGWSVIAAALAWWLTERRSADRHPFFTRWLFVGGAISLFGLIPALLLTINATPEDSIRAAHIYSYERIKHHLLPADFKTWWYVRHTMLISLTVFLWILTRSHDRRWRAIGSFTLGAVLIAVAGLLIGCLPTYAPDLAARLLRYYWFRLTDAIVPLMLGLLVLKLLIDCSPSRIIRNLGIGILVCAIGLVAQSSFQRSQLGVPPSCSNRLLGRDVDATSEEQQRVFADWLAVCRWARAATPEDENFLTPRHQQTFKWYAHRAEVVNWKDVPQDAASLKEWDRRFDDIFPARLGRIRTTIQYPHLRRYRREYGTRFMIVDRRVIGANLPMVRIYPTTSEENETYAVYELPK